MCNAVVKNKAERLISFGFYLTFGKKYGIIYIENKERGVVIV